MTLVGKIFTVLIFIMSLVFMSFAVMVFATHQNWRDMVKSTDSSKPGLEQKLLNTTAVLNANKQEHERTKQQLALEQASRRQALAAQQTRLNNAEKNESDLTKQLNDASAALTNEVIKFQISQKSLTDLEKEIQILRKETQLAQLDRDMQFFQGRRVDRPTESGRSKAASSGRAGQSAQLAARPDVDGDEAPRPGCQLARLQFGAHQPHRPRARRRRQGSRGNLRWQR